MNAIASGKPEEVVLKEAKMEEMIYMIWVEDIWTSNSSSDSDSLTDEEVTPLKVSVKSSVKEQVGQRDGSSSESSSDNSSDDEDLKEAKKRSLEDQVVRVEEDQWYYSEKEVNKVGVQSLTRSGRVYKPNEPKKEEKRKEVVNENERKQEGEKKSEEEPKKLEEEETEPSSLTNTYLLELLRQTKASVSL